MFRTFRQSVSACLFAFAAWWVPVHGQALVPRWSVDIGLDSEGQRFPEVSKWGWTNSLTAAGDQVFVGCKGSLVCLQRATGKVQWRWKTEAGCHLEPVTDAGTVYFLTTQNDQGMMASLGTNSDTGILHALERSTGHLLWKHAFKIDSGLASMPGAGPLLADGRLYVGWGKSGLLGPVNGHILCLESKTGSMLWEKDIPFGFHPKISGNLLVTGFWKELTCLDKVNGEIKWKSKIGKLLKGEILIHGGTVIVGGGSEVTYGMTQTQSWGDIYGFDLQSGNKLWDFDMGHPYDFALIGNSLLVRKSAFLSSAQVLLNARTGAKEWEGEVMGSVTRFAEPDGVLLEDDKKLIWFNPTTRKISKTETREWVYTPSIQKQGKGVAFLVLTPRLNRKDRQMDFHMDLLAALPDGAAAKTLYATVSRRRNPFLVIEGTEALLSVGDGKVVSLEIK